MVQPISLLMAHFNVEHSAQMSRDAIAAAQQTAQGQEVVQESVRRTQRVQASLGAAEVRKVRRRDEDEDGGRRRDQEREEQKNSFRASEHPGDDGEVREPKGEGSPEGPPKKSFDFYA